MELDLCPLGLTVPRLLGSVVAQNQKHLQNSVGTGAPNAGEILNFTVNFKVKFDILKR